MNSILNTIKNLLGIKDPSYTHFDTEIIIHINSALMILGELGVGPEGGYKITSSDEQWTDFVSERDDLEGIKSYIYLRVKLVFDPPASTAAIDSIKNLIDELEWRLNSKIDYV